MAARRRPRQPGPRPERVVRPDWVKLAIEITRAVREVLGA
jgi:hypothetical protein